MSHEGFGFDPGRRPRQVPDRQVFRLTPISVRDPVPLRLPSWVGVGRVWTSPLRETSLIPRFLPSVPQHSCHYWSGLRTCHVWSWSGVVIVLCCDSRGGSHRYYTDQTLRLQRVSLQVSHLVSERDLLRSPRRRRDLETFSDPISNRPTSLPFLYVSLRLGGPSHPEPSSRLE